MGNKYFLRVFLIILLVFSFTSCSSNKKEIFKATSFEYVYDKLDNNTNVVGISKDKSKIYFSSKYEHGYKYFTVDINTGEEDVLYESKDNKNYQCISIEGVYNDILYFAEIDNFDVEVNGKQYFTLNCISVDKEKNIKKTLDKNMMRGDYPPLLSKFPYSYFNNGRIWFTEEYFYSDILDYNKEKVDTRLSYVDIDECNEVHLLKKTCAVSNDLYSGEYIMYGGSLDKNLVYYQVLNCNNENLETSKASVFKYNLKDENTEKISDLDKFKTKEMNDKKNRKLLFLSGDDLILFTSDYIVDDVFYPTGAVNIFKNNDIYSISIPNIEAGTDLLNAQKFDDYYLAFSNSEFYTYDKEGKLLKNDNLNIDKVEYIYGNSFENGFYIYNAEKGKISFKIYEINK